MNHTSLLALRPQRRIAIATALLLLGLLPAGCNGPLLPDPNIRYIAFGDSSTSGPASVNYWEYVRSDLDLPTNTFVNQGQGGETVAEGLPRLQDLLERRIYPNAEVLLYWQGGADVLALIRELDPLVSLSPDDSNYPFADQLEVRLDEVQADIEQVIQSARQEDLTVFVATYFDLVPGSCRPALLNVLLPEQASRANQYVRRLNERIRAAAGNTGATLIDVAAQAQTLAADPANYFDCNHLSEQGNRIVANLFTAAIQAAPQQARSNR